MRKAKILRKNDIRQLLEVKDFNQRNEESLDGQDSTSDCSEKSDISTKPIPQYSSYRTLSGGLFGPFDDAPTKPSSKASTTFFRRTQTKTDENINKNNVEQLNNNKKPRSVGLRRSISFAWPKRPFVQTSSHQTNKNSSLSQQNNSTSHIPIFRREASMPLIERQNSGPNIKSKNVDARNLQNVTNDKEVNNGISNKQTNGRVMKLSKFYEKNSSIKEKTKSVDEFVVGDKVRISINQKKGIVQFVGETEFAKGTWIGVILDDATGKNDGSVGGVRYFTCPSLRGIFVREDNVFRF